MKIPLFPLDVVLFPEAALPLHIFEARYREMIRDCLEQKQAFGVVRAHQEGMAVVGCTAEIVRVINRYPDGCLDILCEGRDRFEIEILDDSRSFLQANVELLHETAIDSTRRQREQCVAMHFELLHLVHADDGEQGAGEFPHLDLDGSVSFKLAAAIPSDLNFKQELLTLRSDAQRCARLIQFYEAVLPKLRRGASAGKAAISNGHVM